MSRKQKREEDLVERLEKENRDLKAEVRSLQRRLKKVDKDFKVDLAEASRERQLADDQLIKKPPAKKCEHCGKGNLFEIDLLGRIFINCDSCDYKARKVTK
jgi:hypothetical protein